MGLPFFGPKLEFELAPPGADPTQRPNPHPKSKGALLGGNLLLILGVLAFVGFGYYKFFYPQQGKASKPTATPPPTATAEPGGFFSSSESSGFLPTQPPTPTDPPPTASPTPIRVAPTATLTIYDYEITVGDKIIHCWCTPDGQSGDAPQCLAFGAFPPPEECRK